MTSDIKIFGCYARHLLFHKTFVIFLILNSSNSSLQLGGLSRATDKSIFQAIDFLLVVFLYSCSLIEWVYNFSCLHEKHIYICLYYWSEYILIHLSFCSHARIDFNTRCSLIAFVKHTVGFHDLFLMQTKWITVLTSFLYAPFDLVTFFCFIFRPSSAPVIMGKNRF